MPVFGLNRNSLPDRFTTVSRVVYGSLNSRQLSSRAVLRVPMAPLLPLIVAGSAMLYHQGTEANKPNGGDRNAWFHILTEAVLGYGVLRYTNGVYPLFGLGLAAYRSGQKSTAHEKIQALVNTAVGLFMGWIGVHLFKSFAEAGWANDDHIIQNALLGQGKHEAKFKHWIDTHLSRLATRDEEAKGLKNSLGDLRKALWDKKLLYKKENKYKGKPDWELVEPLHEKILSLKTDITERAQKLGNQLFTPGDLEQKAVVQAALNKIEDSQSMFNHVNRAMNPIYGYIIMGLMVGAPIAKWLNSKIGHSRPELKSWKMEHSLFPEDNRIITSATYGNNTHGSNHFMVGTPTISWPAVIDDSQSH